MNHVFHAILDYFVSLIWGTKEKDKSLLNRIISILFLVFVLFVICAAIYNNLGT